MAKKACIQYLILVVFLLGGIQLCAQDYKYSNDASLWVNIYLEKKLNDKFDLHLNQKNRFNNNISQLGMAYADVGITFKLNKHFKILADYVFAERLNKIRQYETRHQVYVAFIAKQKVRRWTFLYRNMSQYQDDNFLDDQAPEWYNRNKATVKYEINKRFTAYVAEELYIPFKQNKHKGPDRSRSFAGLFYNLSKKTNIEFYFAYQHELNAFNKTNRDFIYGIGYSHEF